MERRQQMLIGGLIAVVVLWFGSSWFNSAVLEPIQLKREEVDRLEKKVADKSTQEVALAKAMRQLKDWKGQSLPPDPVKSARQKPDALNAQRLYQEWLTDITQESGFEDVKVSPDRNTPKGNVYVSVFVKIEAEARFQQLAAFFDRFYRADLLHRIHSLRVQSRESDGDPFFQVTILAEGLAMVDAPQRRSLFPRLAEDMEIDGTILKVSSLDGFTVRSAPFEIRIKNEVMRVTNVEKSEWTVERGVDETKAESAIAGTQIEILRRDSTLPARSSEEYQELLAANIFVKPAPPAQYRMKFPTLSEKTYVRGTRSFETSVAALGYDSSKGKPEYSLTGKLVAGMQIDKSTGKLTWKPEASVVAGKYVAAFEAKHPSAPNGKLSGSLTIILRDPNTPPRFEKAVVPIVYLGREWSYQPKVTDAESSPEKVLWKFEGEVPAGLSIDSSTGTIKWTPDDSTPLGMTSVKIVATDDGMPPESASLDIKLDVRDDVAMFTKLTGIFSVNDRRRAVLFDQSQNKSVELFEGDSFAVAEIRGVVASIASKHVLFADGDNFLRMELGQHLREARPTEPPIADAMVPANANPLVSPPPVDDETGDR